MNGNMKGKVCLITGANSGIGKQTAVELASLGASVVMVCRNRLRGTVAQTEIMWQSGSNKLEVLVADLSSLSSVRRFSEKFLARYDRLDVLVNNAGIAVWNLSKSVDGIELTFATNYLGHFLLTNLLLGILKESSPSRIVNMSSVVHNMAPEIDFMHLKILEGLPPLQAYAQSKLANLMFTYELARRLDGTGVTVNAVDPWLARTNLASQVTGYLKALRWVLMNILGTSVEKGTRTVVYLASSPRVDGISGKYFRNSRPIRSSKVSYDTEKWLELWNITEELIKVRDKEPIEELAGII